MQRQNSTIIEDQNGKEEERIQKSHKVSKGPKTTPVSILNSGFEFKCI